MIRSIKTLLIVFCCCARIDAQAASLQWLQQRFSGPDGIPSPQAYAQAMGIAPEPGSEWFRWRARLTLVYEAHTNRATTDPLDWDCCLVREHHYRSPFVAQPVWDGRLVDSPEGLAVAAYTFFGERLAGRIDENGDVIVDRYLRNGDVRRLAQQGVRLNPFTGQLWRREPGGDRIDCQQYYLPWDVHSVKGSKVLLATRLRRRPDGGFAVVGQCGGDEVELVVCTRDALNEAIVEPGFAPLIGPGCRLASPQATAVVTAAAQLTDALQTDEAELILRGDWPRDAVEPESAVEIDGRFGDWRNVPGIADPLGDRVSYLDYNPDADLLEFKVRHDAHYLYTYTRVAGKHGNTQGSKDRYYYYVFIDADRNPQTGYIPTRDDNCYFGVAIGDDCETQFEFADGRFVKTFFGFAGGGGEEDVLRGRVRLAPSWYSKIDRKGNQRSAYKVEYVHRDSAIQITEDNTPGTSDDIVIALSADGSQCEMRTALAGFPHDALGKSIIAPGQHIDLAVGVEAAGVVRGCRRWAADNSAVIRDYRLDGRP